MDLKIQPNSKLSGFGDLVLEGGDLVLVDGKEAILQHVLQRLRIFLGEWFLDTSIGLPYFQQILVKNPDQGKIDALFMNQIQGTPGVTLLNSYSASVDTLKRVLTIKFSCETTSGTVNYSGAIAA